MGAVSNSDIRPNSLPSFRAVARRNLVFVHGKGGVGKSSIARAIAFGLSAQKDIRILLVEFENPTRSPGEVKQIGPAVWHLNAEAMLAFDEFAAVKLEKLGFLSSLGSGVTRLFTHNKLIRYLAQAAPGIHELVLLGKVWFERNRYDHVIVDLPSTGYGLAMFQSTMNFSRLFRGGPLAKDAEDMLETFRNPTQTGHVIVALPEEMPLREAIELNDFLKEAFPANPAAFIVNRKFPNGTQSLTIKSEVSKSPYASSIQDYINKRRSLEHFNLKLWSNAGIKYGEIDFFKPDESRDPEKLARSISDQMRERELL